MTNPRSTRSRRPQVSPEGLPLVRYRTPASIRRSRLFVFRGAARR
jgi:hypothetical protein